MGGKVVGGGAPDWVPRRAWREYNRTSQEAIRKAHDHICFASQNLGYGVLQGDFAEERKILLEIARRIRAAEIAQWA